MVVERISKFLNDVAVYEWDQSLDETKPIVKVMKYMHEHWEIPFVSCILYYLAIQFIPVIMADRKAIRPKSLIAVWNFLLSLFSGVGFAMVAPTFFFDEKIGLLTRGYHVSVCTDPAVSYIDGMAGWFVLFFNR
eukprot:UN02919